MRDPQWRRCDLANLFDIGRNGILPSLWPNQVFALHSIPAFDKLGGPSLEFGKDIGSNKTMIDGPTILVSKLNPRIPRVAFVAPNSEVPACASTEFIPYVPRRSDICLRFYKWYFESSDFQRRLQAIATGSTNSHTRANPSQTLKWQVPFPVEPEQGRIAFVLDVVDAAIEKTAAVIAKLKQVRAGLLHDLLSRGLDANGELRDALAHPEQFQDSPSGRIPNGWNVTPFDDVLLEIEAGNSPNYPDYPAPPGAWGVLKVSAIGPNGFRPTENKWVTKKVDQIPGIIVNDGDLLISRSNTYALVGMVCLVTNSPTNLMMCDKTLRLRLRPGRGLNPYFALLLQSRLARIQIEINATGTSGSMKNISQGVIRGVRLAYPDVDEQKRILGVMQPIERHLNELELERAKLVEVKSGLMPDLLTGSVVISEADVQGVHHGVD